MIMVELRRQIMLKTVIRLRNNAVMVFNAEGEQLPEYQGKYEEVREIIVRDAPAGTVFNHWFGYALKPQATAVKDW